MNGYIYYTMNNVSPYFHLNLFQDSDYVGE